MKKIAAIILALVICLGICACGSGEAEIEKILCEHKWSSTNDIMEMDSSKLHNLMLYFYEDGTCERTAQYFRNGVPSNDPVITYENWRIEGGKVVIFPNTADLDTDTVYYEYKDGVLIGSTWYCDRIVYTAGDPIE